MNLSPEAIVLLDWLIRVVIGTAIVAVIPIALILIAIAIQKYKVWKETKKRDLERRIIKDARDEELTKIKELVKNEITADLLSGVINKISDKFEVKLDTLSHVLKVEETTSEDNESEDDVDPEEIKEELIDYKKMTVKQLQQIAKERKIKGYSRMTKDELVSLIDI